MPRIFVYGTLKRGFGNHVRFGLDKAFFVGLADIPNMKLYDVGLPCAIRALKPGVVGHPLRGEVYDIDQSLFARLQRMEQGAGYVTDSESIGGMGVVFFWPVPTPPKIWATIHKEVKPTGGVLEWTLKGGRV